MTDAHQVIRGLVKRVRVRWRTVSVCHAAVRSALAAGAVLTVALVLTHWVGRAPVPLALTGGAALALSIAAVLWGAAPLRDVPSDARVARFIEEQAASLDDRLVTAVDFVSSGGTPDSSSLAGPMLADAAARARAIDLDTIVPSGVVRRAELRAAAAALLLAAVMFAGRGPARQALDAATLSLFPAHVALDVAPGNARIKAGSALAIEATLVGNRAPVTPEVQIADGENWRAVTMIQDRSGRFRLPLESVTVPFRYRVAAGPLVSPTYAIGVAYPPRVARIDVDYTFPPELGLKPRTEEDGGDIYAPAGTVVRLHVHTDRPLATGRMALGDGRTLALAAETPDVWSTTLKIADDTTYRLALADPDGLSSAGDTEYFIRTLADHPPEVHIVQPASDRSVTPLEEVDIEVQADDDYGIERLDLVYSVRGGAEKVLPFRIAPRAPSVSARQTLYLEDLDVQPGDFVSYYARARDLARGSRSSEARSDIFFLEVRPFEQEFSLAQSQSMAGAGYNGSIDDLVNAQKQVVVATWKLDRRSRAVKEMPSERDVRSVSHTEAELRLRVEQTSSSFRESTMRDPRRSPRGGAPRAGQTMPEEDSMTAAAAAMGSAVTSLDALRTADALPPEMEALNFLLKAQAEVKRRQVTRQASGDGGAGNNNRNYDISALFDKELQRAQESNYETQASAEQKSDPKAGELDKIRDLASRQDELLKRQQELTEGKLTAEEARRQLEKLTREQSELRQRAEELARQMQQQSAGQQANGRQSDPRQSNGQESNAQPPASSSGRGGQGSAGAQSGENGGRMRDVSEEMRNATSGLRRQNPEQANASGRRALEKLRELERQLEASRPLGADERRRLLGDMQLETRQLADGERQVASELGKASPGDQDARRRLAAEQERMAERTKRLQEGLSGQASVGAPASGQKQDSSVSARAAGDAARELERQQLAGRMRQSADQIRTASGQGGAGDPRGAQQAERLSKEQARAPEEMARALDSVADRLGDAIGARDDSRKLSEQLARAQDLRERLSSTSREIEKAGQPAGNQRSPQNSPGDTGRSGQGQSGGGAPNGTDLARLREQYARQLKETQDLLDAMRRDDPNVVRGGAGFTFEGRGMTLGAPGTEAFKQDFARWEDLRREATTALDRAEAALSDKLRAEGAKDRLAAGVEDKAPPEYQDQVDSYFRALATRKKP